MDEQIAIFGIVRFVIDVVRSVDITLTGYRNHLKITVVVLYVNA